MDNSVPKPGLYLRNLSKLMEAPDHEVLGVMNESVEWAAKVSNQQDYMDLMMTASNAAQMAEHRKLDWRSAARAHARMKGLSMKCIDDWISGLETV